MKSTFKRELIRTYGFCAGILVSLIFYPPWNDHTRPDFVSDIVRAFAAGCIGVAVADATRRFIPEQRQLDNIEEQTLAEVEIIKLATQRRFTRLAGLVIGLGIPIMVYPLHEFVAHPYIAAWIFFFWVFVTVVAVEFILNANPKQQVLTRILRKKTDGG